MKLSQNFYHNLVFEKIRFEADEQAQILNSDQPSESARRPVKPEISSVRN